MRKFLLFLLLPILAFAAPLQERTIDPIALAQLASALGIPPGSDLIAETQKQWLRKARQERWEMTELSPDQRLFVLNWAQEQHLFDPWLPATTQYDSALILGASTHCMKKRLNYLKQLWEQGIRFNQIVWLTGDRPLDNRIDSLTDRCSTESEAAHILYEEASLPREMHALPVLFIAVPMKGSGRPNTADTLIAWLNTKPTTQTALFVSDQPFCGYQHAIIQTTLPDTIDFDVIGPGVDPTKHPAGAAITLDSIARWIYTEHNSRIDF